MISKLRLGTIFTLMLVLVFMLSMTIGGFILWQILQGQAQRQIRSQAFILIDTMNATRHYTSQHIRPLLQEDLASSTEFISETVPAFSAREVFEYFRQNTQQESFLYKEATLNPTNPRDQADAFETELVTRMRGDVSISELSGFRDVGNERLFYIARPLSVDSVSCLSCHSSPTAAPISLINTFGSSGGFGWILNEIVSAQIIYIPAQEVLMTAFRSFLLMMAVFIITMASTIAMLNFLLRQYVIQPIGVMGDLAQHISKDDIQESHLQSQTWRTIRARSDELGHLAEVFHQMASKVQARTKRLRQEVTMLRIEVDEIKKKQEVDEIVDTDFFQNIKTRAEEMRAMRKKQPGDSEDAS